MDDMDERDGLLGRFNNVGIKNRTTIILFVILGVFTFINFVMALALFGKVDHSTPTITTDKIADKAVTSQKLNPNVAGRGLMQNPNGSLELDINFWAMSHLYEENYLQTQQPVYNHIQVVMGRMGMPIILLAHEQLSLLICKDPICWNTTTVVFTGQYAQMATIIMGADGTPVIAAYSLTTNSLVLIKCHHHECARYDINTVDSNSGYETQVHIGRHGFPIISYTDANHMYLKLARCYDFACTGANFTSIPVAGGIYRMTSLLGVDERPIYAYAQQGTNYLYAVHCIDHGCLQVLTTQMGTWNTTHISGVISGDGRPLWSANGWLVHCHNITCSNFTLNNRTMLPFARHTHLGIDIEARPDHL